jgi:GTP-binding protein
MPKDTNQDQPTVLVIGQPNVGKSTLFNRLTNTNQAIVADLAGTTRDIVEGIVEWQGRRFRLLDSAGLAKSHDELVVQAQAKIAEAIEAAHVIVMIVDGTVPIDAHDRIVAKEILKSNKPAILVINKVDQTFRSGLADHYERLGIERIQKVAAISGQGSGDLLDSIVSLLPDGSATTEAADPNLIKVAILGRPNVGKSSLLNRIIGQSKVLVSDVAGTTRDINYGEVEFEGKTLRLADTAGLRRPGKIDRGIEFFSSLRTKKAIAWADVCVVLIDANDNSVNQDQNIAGMVKDAGKGLILVVSKWDAVEDKEDNTMQQMSNYISSQFQFVWWAPLIFTSAHTGLNLEKLYALIVKVHTSTTTKLSTPALNKLLQQATSKQPPVGLKNTHPKLNYITQTGTQPPEFTVFATHPDMIQFSYPRYLENTIREAGQFDGTPIRIVFKHKRKEER